MKKGKFVAVMIIYWLGFAGVCGVVSAAEPTTPSFSSFPAGDTPFQPFFKEIVEMNPELAAARAKWRSKAALVGPAGSLPDPRLNLGVYLQEVETRVGPQQARFGISQGIPWKGKLKLKSDMAAAGAEVARRQYESLMIRLFSDLKRQVFELLYLNRAIEVTSRHVDLLKEWEALMSARYTTDTVGMSDWIRVQVEMDRLRDRLSTLRAAEIPVISELNRILNRPPDSSFPVTAGMSFPLPEKIPYSKKELIAAIGAANPEIQGLDSGIHLRKFGISLADKNFFPDFKVGIDFIRTGSARMSDVSGSGKDPVVLTFGLTLPLNRRKYRLLKTAASESFVAAEQKKLGRQNALVSQLSLLEFRYEDAVRKMRLYRDKLIPDTRDSLDVTVSGYEAGGDGFLDIVDTERTLLALELGLEQAKTDGLKALASIERITLLPLIRVVPDYRYGFGKSRNNEKQSDGKKEN